MKEWTSISYKRVPLTLEVFLIPRPDSAAPLSLAPKA